MTGPESMEYSDSRLPERQYLPRRREPRPEDYDRAEQYDRAGDYDRDYDRARGASYTTDRETRREPRSERQFQGDPAYDREGGEKRREGGFHQGGVGQYDWRMNRPGQGYVTRGAGARHEWDLPGPYKGRGPKGYRRDDGRIREDISGRLMEDVRIDARDIEVDVRSGEIVLKGSVESASTVRLAEEIAGRVSGVTRVRNELRVRQSRIETGPGLRGEVEQRETRYWQEGRADLEPQPRQGMGSTPEDYRSGMRVGMNVVDLNGRNLGRIKSIEGNEFLLDRIMARDLYVPCDAIRTVGDVVLLNVAGDRIGDMNWRKRQIWASDR